MSYCSIFVNLSTMENIIHSIYQFKRLRLGKTTGWQHRFFDLTILSPIWLGTYDYKQCPIIRNGPIRLGDEF